MNRVRENTDPNTFSVEISKPDMLNRTLAVHFAHHPEHDQISVGGTSGVSTRMAVRVQMHKDTSERRLSIQIRDADLCDVELPQVLLRAALEELFFDVAEQ